MAAGAATAVGAAAEGAAKTLGCTKGGERGNGGWRRVRRAGKAVGTPARSGASVAGSHTLGGRRAEIADLRFHTRAAQAVAADRRPVLPAEGRRLSDEFDPVGIVCHGGMVPEPSVKLKMRFAGRSR